MDNIGKAERAYLGAAKSVSELSDHPRCKIGAVLVSGHRIIASGCNSNVKTYPLQKTVDDEYFGVDDCNGKCHAETSALLPFLRKRIRLDGAVMYTYRETKDGAIAMARPCGRCMRLIREAGIRDIVYTTADGVARERLE